MARQMWTDVPELFRAKITSLIKYYGEEVQEWTYYYGPFVDKGQARAALTREETRVRQELLRSQWQYGKYSQEPVKGHTIEDEMVVGEVQTTGPLTWEAAE